MAQVITAPQPITTTVFLAGAIDMGAAVDWQQWVQIRLAGYDSITLFNPRRKEFTPDTLDEQIWWELDALEQAKHIFLWFPKDAKAPISFFEAGLYWKTEKLIVGAEDGFYRRRNLEITGKYYGVHVYRDLESMINTLLQTLK